MTDGGSIDDLRRRLNPLGLSDQHLRALGLFVAAFGQLELTLFFHLATKAELSPERANQLFGREQFARVLATFSRLIDDEFPDGHPLRAEFRAWRRRATDLSGHRGNAVHVAWMRDQPDQRLVRAVRTRKGEDVGVPIQFSSVAELEAHAREAILLTGELVILGERLGSTVYED